jgi:hypothetical protein
MTSKKNGRGAKSGFAALAMRTRKQTTKGIAAAAGSTGWNSDKKEELSP